MRKTSNNLQELRRRIYQKAKSVPTHRFWGLFTHITHITHMTTLYEAYHQAKKNGGAPGIDGQSFADVEQAGVREFLESIRAGLQAGTYQPQPNRKGHSEGQRANENPSNSQYSGSGGIRRVETDTGSHL